jgi:hypothetical protein
MTPLGPFAFGLPDRAQQRPRRIVGTAVGHTLDRQRGWGAP